MTYQYRVRLIFENPNSNIPVNELENPDSRMGEIRKTPWSDLAAPITVPPDSEYFLTGVSVPPGKKSEESRIDIFQWKQEFGTVVNSVLEDSVGTVHRRREGDRSSKTCPSDVRKRKSGVYLERYACGFSARGRCRISERTSRSQAARPIEGATADHGCGPLCRMRQENCFRSIRFLLKRQERMHYKG